jgi:hypothetical protein
MSGTRNIPSGGGDFAAERHGFVRHWDHWIPEANFSHLLQQNASAAITDYLREREEWMLARNESAASKDVYNRQHHSLGRHHYPQLRDDNRTWSQVIGGFLGNIARDFGWTSQPPASGVEGSPYGRHVYGPNGTVRYEPQMSHAGSTGPWGTIVLCSVLVGGALYYCLRNRSSGGGGAGVQPSDLELGEAARFLAVANPVGGEPAPWLPAMPSQLSGSAPVLASQAAPRQRSLSASF